MSVALITGGQQGIGLGIARALRDAGFRIAIAAEQPERGKCRKAGLEGEDGIVPGFRLVDRCLNPGTRLVQSCGGRVH